VINNIHYILVSYILKMERNVLDELTVGKLFFKRILRRCYVKIFYFRYFACSIYPAPSDEMLNFLCTQIFTGNRV
jgi:hypothetical protein